MGGQAPIRVPITSTGLTLDGLEAQANAKFRTHDNLIYTILAIVAITLVGLVISTVTLYMDQARFNNQAYMDSTMRTGPETARLQGKVDEMTKQVELLSQQLQTLKSMSPNN